jgi:hypothetical protein
MLCVPRNESSPRNKVSLGHFIKQVFGRIQVATFAVHVDEMVSNKEVGRGGVVGKHVVVQRNTFLEAFVASTCVEESGIDLEGVRRGEGVEQ